jgi:hypothetical protein
VAIAPSDVKALYRHGVALEELERLDDAYEVLRRVLAIEPGNAGMPIP